LRSIQQTARTFDELKDLLDSMLADPQTDPWHIARLGQFIETRGASEKSYRLGVVAGVARRVRRPQPPRVGSLGLFKTAAQAANAVISSAARSVFFFDAAEGEKR
jgi:hypothetical protein